ncbi:MAG: hypothetical protein ACM3TR_09815 [Caulobacteraceae bacterium]
MPTVQDLITDIDTIMPNTFTNTDKVRWFNDLQRLIDKDKTREVIYESVTVKDIPTYALPSDCTIDRILYIGVAQEKPADANTPYQEYTYKGLNETFDGYNYFDGINGLFGLYPTPAESGYSIRIIYEKKSTQFTTVNLNVTPDLKEEYHDIFKFHVWKIIASAKKDVALANFYEDEKKEMLVRIAEDRMKERIKTPLKPHYNRWWNYGIHENS